MDVANTGTKIASIRYSYIGTGVQKWFLLQYEIGKRKFGNLYKKIELQEFTRSYKESKDA